MNPLIKNPLPILYKELSNEGFKTIWNHPAFHEYFGAIADYFGLEWEVEANEPLSEDEACEMTFCLEGSFEAGCYTRVRTLLLTQIGTMLSCVWSGMLF